MLKILPPLPDLSTRSPGKMRSSTGVQNAKTPSTASRLSSPPGPSLPSQTLACHSGYTPTQSLQASGQSSRIICCALHSLNQAEKAYPAMKLECLAIVWAVAKFRPYLMSMSFEVYTNHYSLQWLKTMHTGSALLHR